MKYPRKLGPLAPTVSVEQMEAASPPSSRCDASLMATTARANCLVSVAPPSGRRSLGSSLAARLGNTMSNRRCSLCTQWQSVTNIKSEVESELRDELAGLQPEEAAVLALLRARLKQTVDDRFLNTFAPRRPP
jgi:hypothetical protein